MYSRYYVRCQIRFNRLSALLCDSEASSEKCLSCGGSQANDQFRLDSLNLSIEPRPARLNFAGVRFFVNPPFSGRSRNPFEVLDCICHINFAAVNSQFLEGIIKNSSGRANKRATGLVFLIPGLFTHEHDFGILRSLPKNSLRCIFPEEAGLASRSDLTEFVDGSARRNEVCCAMERFAAISELSVIGHTVQM